MPSSRDSTINWCVEAHHTEHFSIAKANHLQADGRLLHFYHKPGPPQSTALPSRGTDLLDESNFESSRSGDRRKERALSDPIAPEPAAPSARIPTAPAAAKSSSTFARPEIQDGTMGFPNAQEDEAMDMEPEAGVEADSSAAPRGSDTRPYRSSGQRDEYRLNNGGSRETTRDNRSGSNYEDRRGYHNDQQYRSPRDQHSQRYDHRDFRQNNNARHQNLYSDRYDQRGEYRGNYRGNYR